MASWYVSCDGDGLLHTVSGSHQRSLARVCCVFAAQFITERLNQVKNDCSKLVGTKMKAKEPMGDTEDVSQELLAYV